MFLKNLTLFPMMKIKLLMLLCLFPLAVGAQMLSLDQALDTAWKRSLGLAMARNDAAIAALQNTAGNAGMLPVVGLNGGISFSNNNIEQRFSNGTEISRNGVGATNNNAALNVSWVLFDGMRMFAERSRLQSLQELGVQGVLQEALRIALNVRLSYHALAREQRLYRYYQSLQEQAKRIASLAVLRAQTGMGSALNQLQAESMHELWLGRLREQEGRIREARAQLAFAMTVDAEQVQTVSDADTSSALPGLEVWMEGLRRHPDLQAAQIQERIALAMQQSVQAQRLPQLRANSAYAYNASNNKGGFFLLNQSNGINGGLTLSWNLYNGGQVRREMEVAALNQKQAALMRQERQRTLESEITRAYIRCRTAHEFYQQASMALEKASRAAALVQQRFETGAAVLLELNEARRSEEDIRLAAEDALFRQRVAESELMALSGKLDGFRP
jgi:outer membrane protein TolC